MRPDAFALAVALFMAGAASAADRGLVQAQPGFGDAVTSPLEDLNLKHTRVPDLLVRAEASPYDLAGMDHCEAVAAEVGKLDLILGPDLDEPPPPGKPSTGAQVKSAAVDVAQDRVHSLIPFRGLVRRLTGAEHNAKSLQDAIRSGEVRRGYLKGVGMHMNCAPPAAPSWFIPKKADAGAAPPGSPAEPFWIRWWRAVAQWVRGLLMRIGVAL